MRTVIVTVTPADRALGWRGSIYRCPLALAASRALGVVCWIGNGVLGVENRTGWRVRLPRRARRWEQTWDYGRDPGPVVFTVEVPPGTLRTA